MRSLNDVLGAIQVRSHIFQVLEGSEQKENGVKLSPDTCLLNELIREYLNFQGYTATNSVFGKEGSLAQDPLPRSFVEERFGLSSGEGASQLPILYSLLRRQQLHTKGGKGCA